MLSNAATAVDGRSENSGVSTGRGMGHAPELGLAARLPPPPPDPDKMTVSSLPYSYTVRPAGVVTLQQFMHQSVPSCNYILFSEKYQYYIVS